MSLRTRLTVIVAVIVAVAVVGGAYAAHVSAQHALNEETDKFLRDRAAQFVHQPPRDLGGDFGGAPTDPDDGQRRYYQFDAIQHPHGAERLAQSVDAKNRLFAHESPP